MQAYFQNQINLASGDINTLTGWNTFLNYYYWLHGSFDTLVGLVLNDLSIGVSPYSSYHLHVGSRGFRRLPHPARQGRRPVR